MDDQDRCEDIKQDVEERLEAEDKRLQEKTGAGDSQLDVETAVDDAEHQLNKKNRSEQKKTWRALDRDNISRREFLKLLGITAVSGAAVSGGLGFVLKDQFPSGPTGNAAANTVNLGDEGLSDGDDIANHLGKIQDNTKYIVPDGTYTFSGGTVSGNNWELVSEDCATISPSGAQRLNLKGSGWKFGGFRFDVSGSKQVMIFPEGGEWTLGNCAWDGPLTNTNYLVYPAVNSGSSAEMDGIWFGSGVGPNRSESAVKGNGKCNGTLWIRRSYFYQNGVYGLQTVNPPPMRGVINFDSCYFENCYLSCLRTGNNYGKTAHVKNCTLLYDSKSETPAIQGRGVKAYRGIWAFWGPVIVENTDVTNPFGPTLITSSKHGSPSINMKSGNLDGGTSGNVTVSSSVGNNPSTKPPEGAPTSVEAVCGSDFGGGSSSSESSSNNPC